MSKLIIRAWKADALPLGDARTVQHKAPYAAFILPMIEVTGKVGKGFPEDKPKHERTIYRQPLYMVYIRVAYTMTIRIETPGGR